MPSVRIIVFGDIQFGVTFRRKGLFRAQNPGDSLNLDEFILVPASSLPPSLLKIGEDIIRCRPINLAMPVMPRLPWTS
jgi:hypothetical protein